MLGLIERSHTCLRNLWAKLNIRKNCNAMDRKLRPHVLHDLLCNLKMVAIPSSASLSPSPVPSYIARVRQTELPWPVEVKWRRVCCSSWPWIVNSWRNLLCICIVPNMMKPLQSLRKSIGITMNKAFTCDFCDWLPVLQYVLLWVIWIHLCMLKFQLFAVKLGHLLCVTLFKNLPCYALLKGYMLWLHGVIY